MVPFSENQHQRKVTGRVKNPTPLREIKKNAKQIVVFLSGCNAADQKIMAPDEYNRFLRELYRLLETKRVERAQKFKMNISEKCQRFILHRLFKELKVGNLNFWARFGLGTWEGLEGWDSVENLYKKMSIPRSQYDDDIRAYLGEDKK